jgi:hypothetical protein
VPHFKNGRPAQVGDPVVGKVASTAGHVAGTLVSVTPGDDACNAQVEFIVALTLAAVQAGVAPYAHARAVPPFSRLSEKHGSAGEEYIHFVCRDYATLSDLLHADDAVDDAFTNYRLAKGVAKVVAEADTEPTHLLVE